MIYTGPAPYVTATQNLSLTLFKADIGLTHTYTEDIEVDTIYCHQVKVANEDILSNIPCHTVNSIPTPTATPLPTATSPPIVTYTLYLPLLLK